MGKKSKKIDTSTKIWEQEDIPDESLLFCYVFKNNINSKTGDPLERAFCITPFKTGKDLSSDWNKYSTPKETLQRLSKQYKPNGGFKNPDNYYVVQLSVKQIRLEIPSQTIEHDPIQNDIVLPENRAHTKIIGEKDPEVKLKFVDIYEWAISPEN